MYKILPLIILFIVSGNSYTKANPVTLSVFQPKDSIVTEGAVSNASEKVMGKRKRRKRAERPERIDRGIMQMVFIPKGQWMAGGTVSYSEHEEDNLNFLVIKNVEALGYTFNLSPYVGYFFKDNMAAGMRLNYNRTYADLGNIDINLGDDYDKVRKVYSINIVYFDLGQGKDYIYHGRTEFRGLHDPEDVLRLSVRQQEMFVGKVAGDVFPEYYVLRVNDFDKVAKTPLDEWVRFLKTGEIDAAAKAKGLPEARERLRIDSLSVAERRAYVRDMEALRYQRSVIKTGWDDGHREGRKEGLAEGRAEGRAEGLLEGRAEGHAEGLAEGREEEAHAIAKRLLGMGLSLEMVAQATGLSVEELKLLSE